MSYTPDQVSEITLLRHERWALYAELGEMRHTPDNLPYGRIANRLKTINLELFVITENPIYKR